MAKESADLVERSGFRRKGGRQLLEELPIQSHHVENLLVTISDGKGRDCIVRAIFSDFDIGRDQASNGFLQATALGRSGQDNRIRERNLIDTLKET
jgi:hypothetical protein